MPGGAIAFRAARIDVERIRFFDADVVVVVDPEKTQRPLHRLESGLAFKEVDPDLEIVREEKLLAPAKKFRAVRTRRAHSARHRQPARFKLREIRQRQIEENVLSENGRIALEFALQIRVPEFQRAGLIGSFRAGIGVALPAPEAEEPPVRHRLIARRNSATLLRFRIFRILEFAPTRDHFAHSAARQPERAWDGLFTVIG